MDVLMGNVPVTEISTLDPGKISTTADTEILGWTKFKKTRKRKLWMNTDDFSNRHYYPHNNHYH